MSYCSQRTLRLTAYILIAFGVGLILVGIILAATGALTDLVKKKIKEELPLKPGSESFEKWEKPPDRLLEYYIFNITDTNVTGGKVPKIEQVGPYSYRKILSKNVTKRENSTLTYVPKKQYIFDPASSCETCRPMEDRVTALNYPLLVLIDLLSKGINGSETEADEYYRMITRMYKIGLFQNRFAHELLWGYKDPTLVKAVKQLLFFDIPDWFALQVNNTGSGVAKVYTGETDVDRVGEYVEWRESSTLKWWNSSQANMINGTDGSRFKPFIKKSDVLYILAPQVYRSVKLVYEQKVEAKGIDLYRFIIPKEEFLSGDVNPNNKGFCVTGHEKKCLPSGLLDIKVCQKQPGTAPPVVISFPHFYNGEKYLSRTFDMIPVKTRDEALIDVEPNTGVAMRFHRRLQLNMAVSNWSIYNMLLGRDTSNPVFLPVFYADESGVISDKDADDFKTNVLVPIRVLKATPYILIGLGVLLLFAALFLIIFERRRRSDSTKTDGFLMDETG